ncbi:MAG: LysR substrate-binding domain-containing protein [Alphaproteobacteria bacterium]
MQTLDLDQLRTFSVIAEVGSFTGAAERINKTQSAVSMQMKRLEETVGLGLFVKQGRRNLLTAKGEALLGHANRLLRLNDEAMQTFISPELSGLVRIGTPDDYAERYLPPILARFSRTHPLVDLEVSCQSSSVLAKSIKNNDLDLAIVTQMDAPGSTEIIRQEPLLWVTSRRHCAHTRDILPLALAPETCCWRRQAIQSLIQSGREHRVVYTTHSAAAIVAAVLSGLAITAMPESAMRPGMDVLGAADGFAPLKSFSIALLRGTVSQSGPVAALADHITDLLGNFSYHNVIAAE